MPTELDRRSFMSYFTGVGLASTLFPGVLWAKFAAGAEITVGSIASAEDVAGVHFDQAERELMLDGLKQQEQRIEALHKIPLANSVSPAIVFDPLPPGKKIEPAPRKPMVRATVALRGRPADLEDLAFLPVAELSELVRRKQVTSLELTQMYLARLKKYDPVLRCVISLTEERALKQARAADAEIARGRYRGPLHGIPWGAKDLLAVRGYKTTWGAGPFKNQVIDTDATVVQRLDAAGAVLVAKLTLGELAQGDIWFDATTKNPWKVDQGSSGSSAGPASATAAGLVGFSVGSETLGSISSPSTRCGTTGLRPTFGRVPRTGAMALSWTMDKLGPLCRAVEDCALVLSVISGPDGQDGTVHDYPFVWNPVLDIKKLRVGYVKSEFEKGPTFPDDATPEIKERITKTRAFRKKFDEDTVDVLRSKLGLNLVAVEMPKLPYSEMLTMLSSEAAAAFDDLTRSGRDKLLNAQGPSDWPNSFRSHR